MISVVKVIKEATTKSKSIGDKCVNSSKWVAIESAKPVALKALAIEKPAPNKNIILKGTFLLSSSQSKILKGERNSNNPNESNMRGSLSPNPSQ